MKSYDFDTYKDFILERIRLMPKQGRGELSKLAAALRTPATRLSYILRGDGNLTLEQAKELCRYFGVGDLETEFILTSVLKERAGTVDLRKYCEQQLQRVRERGREIVNRITSERVLSNADRATFYSSWIYSAVHLASSVPELDSIDALAVKFDIPLEKLRPVVEFLVSRGLCREEGTRLSLGTSRTHLEASSPLVARHHSNWRLKAIERFERLGPSELAFTCQVSVSKDDRDRIREDLVRYVERFYKQVEASEPVETLACLNIDWIEI